jgi:hypothetical protein
MWVFPLSIWAAGALHTGWQRLQAILQWLQLAAVLYTCIATQVGLICHAFTLKLMFLPSLAVSRKPVSIPDTIIAAIQPLLLPSQMSSSNS